MRELLDSPVFLLSFFLCSNLGAVNHGLSNKSTPPGFVNKAVLEHSQAYPFKYCLFCFQTITAELRNCDEDHILARPKMFTSWTFIEFANFLIHLLGCPQSNLLNLRSNLTIFLL